MKAATDKGTQTLLGNRLLKVLLVDDEATDRIPVERILRTCSSPAEFVVESVVNLSGAIKNLTEKQYDVVLLDLELPDSSGIEILQQVIKVAPDIPVVVLTELDDEQTGFSALEDGATDYLVKDLPLDVVLVRTIVYAIQRKKIQMQSLKLAHDNYERMKELNCLYVISKLVEDPGISLEEMLEKTVRLLPAGWQYPDIACARIVFEGKEYKTDNFKQSKWTQRADIKLNGEKAGTVEVGYIEERPQSDEGPFLEEKRDLIDAIGERLGKMAERFKVEEVLREKSATFNLVLNTVPQSIFWKDLEGRYLGCNRVFADAVGLDDPARIVGKTDFDLPWPREEAEAYRTDDRNVIENNRPKLHIIERLQQADGHRLWIDTSKMPLCDAHGRPFALLGVYDDITEHKKTEEMLREKSVLLAKVINSVPDFIFAKDTKLRDIICNEAYASAVGKKPEEMIGHTDIENGWDPELVCGNPAKGIRGFENDDRDALSGKTIHNSYDPANTPNGVLIFDTYKMPLRGKDGEIIGMLGISRNITESKRAEETLRESERKKHAFFDRTFQLVGLTTTDGILIEANKTSLEFSGVEASSVLNKPFWQGPWWAHSPELQEKLRQAVVKAACGESIRFEATHVDKNGMLHYVDFSLKPVKDETGKVIFLIPEGSDITGRKKAENALRESEERYKNLFMANIDGMLVADATTKKFRYANPAICRMLGYSEEEFTQMGVADIHPKESLERVIAEFEAMASGAKITAKDLPCVRKDGQVISVNISTVTVMMDQTKYMLGIFHDITERKSKGKEDFS